MKELIQEYFWQLFFLLASAWYWGFVAGKWWERIKDEEQPDQNDEIWW